MGDGVLSNFFLSYSTSQSLTGPWTTPELLYETETDPNCEEYSPNYELNYAGHAYPLWDASGKTLLLSWSSCSAWVSMVELSFA